MSKIDLAPLNKIYFAERKIIRKIIAKIYDPRFIGLFPKNDTVGQSLNIKTFHFFNVSCHFEVYFKFESDNKFLFSTQKETGVYGNIFYIIRINRNLSKKINLDLLNVLYEEINILLPEETRLNPDEKTAKELLSKNYAVNHE
jgi:hypothetical protein